MISHLLKESYGFAWENEKSEAAPVRPKVSWATQNSSSRSEEAIDRVLTASQQPAVQKIKTWYEQNPERFSGPTTGGGNFRLTPMYRSPDCTIRVQENLDDGVVSKVIVHVKSANDHTVLSVSFTPGKANNFKVSLWYQEPDGNRATLEKLTTDHHAIPGLSDIARAALQQTK